MGARCVIAGRWPVPPACRPFAPTIGPKHWSLPATIEPQVGTDRERIGWGYGIDLGHTLCTRFPLSGQPPSAPVPGLRPGRVLCVPALLRSVALSVCLGGRPGQLMAILSVLGVSA